MTARGVLQIIQAQTTNPKDTPVQKILLFALIAIAAASMFVGKLDISLADYAAFIRALCGGERAENFELVKTIILDVRAPRIIACVLIGASLAASGATYQAIFLNPLVSPSILGVLSGASFGAALGMILGASGVAIQAFTFAFGFLAVGVAVFIGLFGVRSRGVLLLILGGVISSSFFSSLLSLLKYAADPTDTLPRITYFLLGSLSFVSKEQIALCALPMLAGVVVLLASHKVLNALALGEDEARALGVETTRAKLALIVVATFVSSLSVMLCGVIGWIGLVVPHIVRFLCGANNRAVLFGSAVVGGAFLLVCDNLSRVMFSYEVPIGIVTSFVGIPIFVAVLRKSRKF